MDSDNLQPVFLEEDATLEQRWKALRINNRLWFECLALAGGGEVSCNGDFMWTHASDQCHIVISSFEANEHVDTQLVQIISWYRSHPPFREVICWYLAPITSSPVNLTAQLFARGFAPNWQPHWMWCDLRDLQRADSPTTACDVRLVEDTSEWHIDDLPYYSPEDGAVTTALIHKYPRQVWQVAAFLDREVVGRCVLNMNTGKHGVAAIFAMGVVPYARNQGIGAALTIFACELALGIGCRHVYVNATEMGGSLYRRIGFQSMGHGCTWLLPVRTLTAPSPTRDQVAFLEAIGKGDVKSIETIAGRLPENFLNEPSLNGMTPLDIAVRCQQPSAATWLIEHGVHLDLTSAWDLGWKGRISSLLAGHPELVNIQSDQWGATPLHIAVERNDVEFARLILVVPNDLTIKDTSFGSTALGWARHFNRTEMVNLIEEHRNQARKVQRVSCE